ncbi:Integrase-like protein [Gossypium australe]|uniref:Integrase-like protein n=1 Tax=Gossypium australe TaxID=47621 RepID=A0A5B6X0L4_9ROSI|nr:Integrase-like protein [Gossypium australe]
MIQDTLQFRGNMMEDPNQHLKWFLQLPDTFKYNEVSNDAIRLWLFPFSLDQVQSQHRMIQLKSFYINSFHQHNHPSQMRYYKIQAD